MGGEGRGGEGRGGEEWREEWRRRGEESEWGGDGRGWEGRGNETEEKRREVFLLY